MHRISVVVPIYNEEGNVKSLHEEIRSVCEKNRYEYEIIFVNDGSSDRTDEICRTLSPLKYICMRKNFGQTAAMDVGIKAARYDYIVTMDGDRQNNPEDIPRMLDYLIEQDLDVVSGWRKNRKDSFMKKFISRGANLLRGVLVKDGIHDSGCSLKIYKRECFQGMNLYGEQHRFIPALLKIKGFRVGELVVDHRPRTCGSTKYNWHRTIKGFVDMISVWFWNKYASRPLHILGGFGMVFLGLGLLCGVWSVVLYLTGAKMSGYIMVPLMTVFFCVIGLLMFIFGLMSEILMKTYYGVHVDAPYAVKETLEISGNREQQTETAAGAESVRQKETTAERSVRQKETAAAGRSGGQKETTAERSGRQKKAAAERSGGQKETAAAGRNGGQKETAMAAAGNPGRVNA